MVGPIAHVCLKFLEIAFRKTYLISLLFFRVLNIKVTIRSQTTGSTIIFLELLVLNNMSYGHIRIKHDI